MNATLQNWLTDQIQELKDNNLYKVPRILESAAGGRVQMDGKEVINFSSNNYLGLANHPKVRQAALDSIERWGVGAGAVRWIGGWCVKSRTLRLNAAETVLPGFRPVMVVLSAVDSSLESLSEPKGPLPAE